MLRSLLLSTLLLATSTIGTIACASTISALSSFQLKWQKGMFNKTGLMGFYVVPARGCSATFSHVSVHTDSSNGWQTLETEKTPFTSETYFSLNGLRDEIKRAIMEKTYQWDGLEYNVSIVCDHDIKAGEVLLNTYTTSLTSSVFSVSAPSAAVSCEAVVEDHVTVKLAPGASSGPLPVAHLTKGGSSCRVRARESRVTLTNGGAATYSDGSITVTAGAKSGVDRGAMTVEISVD